MITQFNSLAGTIRLNFYLLLSGNIGREFWIWSSNDLAILSKTELHSTKIPAVSLCSTKSLIGTVNIGVLKYVPV